MFDERSVDEGQHMSGYERDYGRRRRHRIRRKSWFGRLMARLRGERV
jgi:hypothetical protein